MPISAQQWRVAVGRVNASRTLRPFLTGCVCVCVNVSERKRRGGEGEGGGGVCEEEKRKVVGVCHLVRGLTSSTNSCVLACRRLLKLSDSFDSSETRSCAHKRKQL